MTAPHVGSHRESGSSNPGLLRAEGGSGAVTENLCGPVQRGDTHHGHRGEERGEVGAGLSELGEEIHHLVPRIAEAPQKMSFRISKRRARANPRRFE